MRSFLGSRRHASLGRYVTDFARALSFARSLPLLRVASGRVEHSILSNLLKSCAWLDCLGFAKAEPCHGLNSCLLAPIGLVDRMMHFAYGRSVIRSYAVDAGAFLNCTFIYDSHLQLT